MLTLELVLLSVTVLGAAFAQGTSGLGFALVVAPVAGLLALLFWQGHASVDDVVQAW